MYMYLNEKFSPSVGSFLSVFPKCTRLSPSFRCLGVDDTPGVPVVKGKGTVPAGTTEYSHPRQFTACDPSGPLAAPERFITDN